MAEEALVLRLPPRIATKLTARLNQQERSRSEGPLFQRRRRKRKNTQKSTSSSAEKTELASLVEAVWGEEGAPDYDSMDEASGDLLDLVLGEEEEDAEQDDETANNKMEDEDFSSLSNDQIDYWRVTGKEYIFQFGSEQLHATLINLPCVVETQKLTADSLQVYKTGNIGQALVVHDCPASTPRSECALLLPQEDFVEHTYSHGITPPMHHIAQRFARNTSQARRNVSSGMQLTVEDISQADERMNDMKELVLAKNKKQDVQPEKQVVRKNAKQQGAATSSAVTATGSTVFVHEELIDSEPWMEDHPEDVIVVEPGTDRFVTSTKLQQKRARDNFQKKKEEQQRVGNFVQQQQQQQPAMQFAPPNYIPALANPMEQQHGNMFQQQRHTSSPPFNYAGNAAQSPSYQQQYSPGAFQQGSPPSYAGSPAYASSSPSPGAFQQSPYGGGGMSHQSPMLSAGSPTAAAMGAAAQQDPMLRVQELRRRIDRATEEARNLTNPQLRLRKEATIAQLQDELRRLEPSVL